MARPDIDIEVWASESYTLPNAQTINKIRPITDLWRKGYDLGEKPDCQAWNYVWNMLCVWMQYVAEEQIPGLDDVFLKKTGNLSELSDKVTSRTNLGVYSKAETDDRYLQLVGGTITGDASVAGTTTTANLTVQSNNAVVGGRHVVRSVNGATADANGNATISLPAQGVMGIRLGGQQEQSASNNFTVPSGCVVVGLRGWKVTGPDFELDALHYRPIQQLLNGSWVTVSQT